MQSFLCLNTISRFARKTPRAVWAAVLASFAAGLLVYSYAINNIVLCTGDALTNAQFSGNLVWLGRWSSQWLSALSTDYSIPAVATLLTIGAVSLLGGVAASLLEIRSAAIGALVGITLICFPSVGKILSYFHNTDAYMIASLLAALAVWLADRKPFRFWYFPAAILLAVGVGTYQATLSLAVALMFVRAVQLILCHQGEDGELCKVAARYAAVFLCGLALYYVMVKVSTALSGIPLTDYQSTSRMGQFTLAEFGSNFLGCYRDFKKEITFLSFRPGYYVSGYSNYLFVAIAAALVPICYLLSEKKTLLRTVILVLLMVLSPVLLCSIRLANPSAVESRMTYSVVGLYLLGMVLSQFLSEHWSAIRAGRLTRIVLIAASWILILCLLVAVFVWSVGINLDFYRGRLTYEQLYDNCSEYFAAAQRAEGYEAGMPIYIVGNPAQSGRHAPALSMPKYYYAFMVHYMNIPMPYGIANSVDDAAKALRATDAFAQIPCWPAQGSAACIGEAVVIKLSD